MSIKLWWPWIQSMTHGVVRYSPQSWENPPWGKFLTKAVRVVNIGMSKEVLSIQGEDVLNLVLDFGPHRFLG